MAAAEEIPADIREKMMVILKVEEEKTDLDNLAVLSKIGLKVASSSSSELDADAASASSTALIDLGYLEDPCLRATLELQARMITGDGIADSKNEDLLERYYAYTPSPLFACGPNIGLSCA